MQGIHFTRGNHETKAMNKIYGFEGEVKAKFDETMAELFHEVFCCLPLVSVTQNATLACLLVVLPQACILGKKVFIVHGGLFSRDNVSTEELKSVHRLKEPPEVR